jgi:hypothetical protein
LACSTGRNFIFAQQGRPLATTLHTLLTRTPPVKMRRAANLLRPMHRIMRACSLILAVSALLLAAIMPMAAHALELVLYDKPGCVWCARFERDIGRRYSGLDVSRVAPLRRVDIHDQRRSGVGLERPVIYTPTFILADDGGEEIGRITGYQSEEAFWANLDDLLRGPPRERHRY